jgi:sulfur relay (sulfurtransferase) DsrC/TusE family protein
MSDAGKLLPNNGIDVNGKEIILDADADTSITADTDDQIDIRIAGADDFAFKANTFEVQTGSNIDMNGTELILDADGDTSVTADTDDQIDIRIAGADDFQFTANTFTILAGSTLVNSGSQSSDISSTGKAAVFGF